jgi:hypothetical protein
VVRQLERQSEILAVEIKKYREWLKSDEAGIADYTSELERLDKAKREVESLLFEPMLQLGPIVLHCQDVKE